VTVPGKLLESIRPGSVVHRGDAIARLSRSDLESEVIRLTGELAVERQQLDSLRRQQVRDTRSGVSSSGGQLAVLEQSAQDLARQLQQRREELAQLVVRSPEDGVLLAPAARPREANESDLPDWSGTPLDPENTGCSLEAGSLLGYVGDPSQREVLVLVDQANVADLKSGQKVQVQLDELPGQFLAGRVASLATLNTEDVPPELVAKGRLPVTSGQDGRPRALGIHYALQVALDGSCSLPFGSSGEAKIRVTSRTLARRIGNSLYRIFGFGV
jgi:hypothetical protein